LKKLVRGLHHVTATVDDAQDDLDCSIDLLQFRLLKKMVNLDNHNLPGVATRAAASGYPNPRTATVEAVLALLERAYTGLPPVPAP
jgi:catechol 2,3-dioxygenase-like lactoylglutathione lyase family enzyme